MKPSIGRIVHYYDSAGTCLAATITAVLEEKSGLCWLNVAPPGGAHYEVQAAMADAPTAVHWTWPPRV